MLTVSVISPERAPFGGTVDRLGAPACDGEVGILPKHAPMMALLGKGELRLGDDGRAGKFLVEGGFVQVLNDTVRVVTEHATIHDIRVPRG